MYYCMGNKREPMKPKLEVVVWVFGGVVIGSVLGVVLAAGAGEKIKAGIELSEAALAPLIALLAVYIAFRQVRNDELRRRIDLYDRRHTIYQGISRFLLNAVREASVTDEDLRHLSKTTAEGFFLFGAKFEVYVKELNRKGARLMTIRTALESGTTLSDAERASVIQEQSELLNWIGEQFKDSKRLFESELRLE